MTVASSDPAKPIPIPTPPPPPPWPDNTPPKRCATPDQDEEYDSHLPSNPPKLMPIILPSSQPSHPPTQSPTCQTAPDKRAQDRSSKHGKQEMGRSMTAAETSPTQLQSSHHNPSGRG